MKKTKSAFLSTGGSGTYAAYVFLTAVVQFVGPGFWARSIYTCKPAECRITTGTIVDATILHAATSTKNREQQRDLEMHQTEKGTKAKARNLR
jgi:hypothetical protein